MHVSGRVADLRHRPALQTARGLRLRASAAGARRPPGGAAQSVPRPAGGATPQGVEITLQRLEKSDSFRSVLRLHGEARSTPANATFLAVGTLVALAKNVPSARTANEVDEVQVNRMLIASFISAHAVGAEHVSCCIVCKGS